MIETAVSSLAHQAIDATSERLHDTTERLQNIAARQPPTRRKSRGLLRFTLWSFVVAAIGVGLVIVLKRRAQAREVAPDAFGDAVERERGNRDFATLS